MDFGGIGGDPGAGGDIAPPSDFPQAGSVNPGSIDAAVQTPSIADMQLTNSLDVPQLAETGYSVPVVNQLSTDQLAAYGGTVNTDGVPSLTPSEATAYADLAQGAATPADAAALASSVSADQANLNAQETQALANKEALSMTDPSQMSKDTGQSWWEKLLSNFKFSFGGGASGGGSAGASPRAATSSASPARSAGGGGGAAIPGSGLPANSLLRPKAAHMSSAHAALLAGAGALLVWFVLKKR